ncbi:MAG: hypothetical protein IKU24_01060 [Clostridia bacterium]|nr:hypothetical protein [Clostridia bacterium]
MKKLIALLLAMVMLVSLVSCAAKDSENKTNEEPKTETNNAEGKEEASSSTVGQTLLGEFKKDSSGTALEIAERLISNEIIPFFGGAMAIEEGFLSGFDNAEIHGFKEGATFGPMMGSIAFVGYIFELDADADVEAFKKELKDNANLRWNICVEAEEMVVENEGSKVFFLMCPKAFDVPEEETEEEMEEGTGDMDLGVEDMIPAEDGITLG